MNSGIIRNAGWGCCLMAALLMACSHAGEHTDSEEGVMTVLPDE